MTQHDLHPANTMIYRREIDGLRALAVLPIIIFHAGSQWFSGGFIGVDIFFVISGYLITSIILSEKKAGEFRLLRFYERRARRILPALFLVMMTCIPFAWLWLLPVDMKSFSQTLVAVPLFASNELFYLMVGYFDTAAELKPLLHTWSLAVEEQYYLLFPLLILFIWSWGKRRMVILLATLTLASLMASYWVSLHNHSFSFFQLPTRAWEILIGALIAFYLAETAQKNIPQPMRQWGSALGLTLIVYAMVAFNNHTSSYGLYALVPTIGTTLIIVFADARTLIGKLLGTGLLAGIGRISYSAYLWHHPLFAFARNRSIDEPSNTVYAALFMLTFLLAYATWRYIEIPFRDNQRISRKQMIIYASGCIASFIIIGGMGQWNNGYPQRLTAATNRFAEGMSDINPRQKECLVETDYPKPDAACVLGHSAAIVGALVGDSHADTLAVPLTQALAASQRGFKSFTYAGCPPADNIYREAVGKNYQCLEFNRDTLAYILNHPQIKTVVMMARWSLYSVNAPFDNAEGGTETSPDAHVDVVSKGQRETNDESARARKLNQRYADTVHAYLKQHKRVILVYPIPEVGWNVPRRLAKKSLFSKPGDPVDVTTSDSLYQQRNKAAIDGLDAIGEDKNLIRIYPEKIFCNVDATNRCITQRNGTPLYYDTNHLSNAGARLVVDEIMKYVEL